MLALLVLAFALLAIASPACADRRVALLIGNSAYSAVPALANPHRDVNLLKSALEAAGFDEVRTAFDLGQKPLLKALNSFADAAADADIAVIYYSGHGLEMGGVNYLVPVDATLATDTDVADETVTLERAMQALDGAKRLKLVILDACRTNPFLASIKIRGGRKAIEKGLAPFEPADSDTLVAYAAKAGTPAYDGDGENSPFAAALARRLVAPGDDVEIALRKVRDDVLAATHNRQEPFSYGSLSGTIIPLSKLAPAAQPDIADAQTAYDAAMGAGTVEALDAFLAKYPVGGLAKSARRERDRLANLAAIVPGPVATAAPSPAASAPAISILPTNKGRAAFLLATNSDVNNPTVSLGTVVWSSPPAAPHRGGGSDVRADVEIPELKLHVSMVFSKNVDLSLPASNTIDLRFAFDDGAPFKGIKDAGVPILRQEDKATPTALHGTRVVIDDKYILFGLPRGNADIQHNRDAISSGQHNRDAISSGNWFDVPILLLDGRIAKLTFEKGGEGEKIIAAALSAGFFGD